MTVDHLRSCRCFHATRIRNFEVIKLVLSWFRYRVTLFNELYYLVAGGTVWTGKKLQSLKVLALLKVT